MDVNIIRHLVIHKSDLLNSVIKSTFHSKLMWNLSFRSAKGDVPYSQEIEDLSDIE